MSSGDTVANYAGRALGTVALIESLRDPGGLGRQLIARQTAIADPSIRSSLVGSPFTAGVLGVGGDSFNPDTAGMVAPEFLDKLRGLGLETPPATRTFIPELPPLNPEAAYKNRLAMGDLSTLFTASPRDLRMQGRERAGLPQLPGDVADTTTELSKANLPANTAVRGPGYSYGEQEPQDYATQEEAAKVAQARLTSFERTGIKADAAIVQNPNGRWSIQITQAPVTIPGPEKDPNFAEGTPAGLQSLQQRQKSLAGVGWTDLGIIPTGDGRYQLTGKPPLTKDQRADNARQAFDTFDRAWNKAIVATQKDPRAAGAYVNELAAAYNAAYPGENAQPGDFLNADGTFNPQAPARIRRRKEMQLAPQGGTGTITPTTNSTTTPTTPSPGVRP